MERDSDQSSSSMLVQFGVCSICTDSLGDGEIGSTKCGHVYHSECIKRWLENSQLCPVCRTHITTDCIIRIYPGSEETNVSSNPITADGRQALAHCQEPEESLLTEEELEALTNDAFRNQNIVYTQLAVLGKKLAEQTAYIETLKEKLEDSNDRYKYEKGEKEAMSKNLAEATESLDNLQVVTSQMKSENDLLSTQLGEIDATMEYMDRLVEQHKSDYIEAKERINELEEEMEKIQEACGGVEETFSRIKALRNEVESEENASRPVDDFIEDLVAENLKLKAEVKDSARTIETKDYVIMDLELNLNGLRETMKEIQVSYADQSSESKEMEEALSTMQRLYKEQTEELDSLKSERDLYEKDVKDMIGSLKRSESLNVEMETKRRQSEMLNQSYEGELAQLKAILGRLEKEKTDAVMMVQLKEDVIKSLQESIRSTTDSYFEKLESLGIMAAPEVVEDPGNSDALTLLNTRFKVLTEEIEKKDSLVMHLMTEKNEMSTLQDDNLRNNVENDITISEMKDSIEIMTERVAKLQRESRRKENQIEEKELVIAHLVNVINRYAFNDRNNENLPSIKKTSVVSSVQTSPVESNENSPTTSVLSRSSRISLKSKSSVSVTR